MIYKIRIDGHINAVVEYHDGYYQSGLYDEREFDNYEEAKYYALMYDYKDFKKKKSLKKAKLILKKYPEYFL
jgi:hypothetical protein